MKRTLDVATLIVVLLPCVSAFGTVIVETVSVGDVGNQSDIHNIQFSNTGRVDAAYSIGKYEVTVGQYAAFLNAVAATDVYGLYNPNMATDLNVAGIARIGTPGSYSYSVIGSPDHPVTYVGWGDAARFANWLNNGQPVGLQDNTTTEEGAYFLHGATSEEALTLLGRQLNAKWFLPSENQWYKSAYYQPPGQGGDSDGYWQYPMKSNSTPYSDQPPGATPNNSRVGNFFKNDGLANGFDDGFAVTASTGYNASLNYLTDVGAYSSSASYYGTFDQGGNVSEWNEYNANVAGFFLRGVLGGAWNNSVQYNSPSGAILWLSPISELATVGFRVASIPEPTSVLLLLAGFGLASFSCRYQRKCNGSISWAERQGYMRHRDVWPVVLGQILHA